jgi:hypothetical protein
MTKLLSLVPTGFVRRIGSAAGVSAIAAPQQTRGGARIARWDRVPSVLSGADAC